MARAKLETEPFNLDSWEVIARDAQLRRIDDSRKIFEEIVDVFPTSGKFWKMYIEMEVGGSFEASRFLSHTLSHCLTLCVSVGVGVFCI